MDGRRARMWQSSRSNLTNRRFLTPAGDQYRDPAPFKLAVQLKFSVDGFTHLRESQTKASLLRYVLTKSNRSLTLSRDHRFHAHWSISSSMPREVQDRKRKLTTTAVFAVLASSPNTFILSSLHCIFPHQTLAGE